MQLQLDDRAGQIRGLENRPQAVAGVGACDLELVRTRIAGRRLSTPPGVLGIVDGERAEQRAALFYAAVKDVHVAEKVHHERAGGVVEDFGRARVLLDWPSFMITMRSASSSASS